MYQFSAAVIHHHHHYHLAADVVSHTAHVQRAQSCTSCQHCWHVPTDVCLDISLRVSLLHPFFHFLSQKYFFFIFWSSFLCSLCPRNQSWSFTLLSTAVILPPYSYFHPKLVMSMPFFIIFLSDHITGLKHPVFYSRPTVSRSSEPFSTTDPCYTAV